MSTKTKAKQDKAAEPPVNVTPDLTPPVEGDSLLNFSEIARMINKHPSTILRWVTDGLLKSVRLPSGLRGVWRSEINSFLGGTALPIKKV